MTDITLPAPVQAFVDAINRGDTDAFVATFTEDGFIDDWGRVMRGRDGVHRWAGSDAIGARARMNILSATSECDITRVRFGWSSRVFNGESDGIFVVDGERLASFTILPNH